MKSSLILVLCFLFTFACADTRFVSDIPMRQVAPGSRVGVQNTDSGFRMRVEYVEKNEAIHRVIEHCEIELISFAEQYASTYPRKIEPIQKNDIKVSIMRLPSGVRGGSCEATTRVKWAAETLSAPPE